MNIKQYCTENTLTFRGFAKRLDIAAPYVTQIVNGARRPSPGLALRIEQATRGAVTRDELLFPELYEKEENLNAP